MRKCLLLGKILVRLINLFSSLILILIGKQKLVHIIGLLLESLFLFISPVLLWRPIP